MAKKTAAPGPQPQDEYIAVSGRLLYAGGGRLWVLDPVLGQVLEVPEEAGPLLRLADRFRTLPGHRKALLEAGWQDDGSGSLDAMLASLVRSGALRSRGELLRRILEEKPEAPPPPITSIAWVTRDRPELLRRSVESAVANLQKYGRRVELRVYDDTAEAQARRDTRAMLAELGKRVGFPMHYAGAEEKHAFVAALQARAGGVSAETLEFALFDPLGIDHTPGANSNAALLDSCGQLVLHADDDTVFRFASLPEAGVGLRLSSALDPTGVRFFATAQEREAAGAPGEVDILAAHEALLGRTVADCLRQAGGQADCRELSMEQLPLPADGARVAATMAGVCGDSGLGSSLFVLWLSGRSRELALRSERHYREALHSREILRAAPQPTLSASPFFMTMHCGLDNRLALPPFLPVLRNADGLFGQLLRAGLPEARIAHLPAAVEHLPGQARAYPEPPRLQPRLADLLVLLVRSLSPAPWLSIPASRLAAIGGGLVQAGRLPPSGFEGLMRELWASEMSRHIVALERLNEEHKGEPSYWASDLGAWQEEIRRRVTSEQPLVPVDLASLPSGLPASEQAQRLARAYGELLLAWPELRAASVELLSSGVSLARRL